MGTYSHEISLILLGWLDCEIEISLLNSLLLGTIKVEWAIYWWICIKIIDLDFDDLKCLTVSRFS